MNNCRAHKSEVNYRPGYKSICVASREEKEDNRNFFFTEYAHTYEVKWKCMYN